ncbi:hypothetical protein NDU88_010467 [Pleurodeles waltl]|uniref:Uncharacterized protein n=1 Tax=Pleurodeles waltl TaxID=8319 RepID=A0AAV7PYZ1_PLEWA|nr:hypothetical protein NDU88_010467 [Pleurodeles waltl]
MGGPDPTTPNELLRGPLLLLPSSWGARWRQWLEVGAARADGLISPFLDKIKVLAFERPQYTACPRLDSATGHEESQTR